MEYVIAFFISIIIYAAALWGGMKLTKVEGDFRAILLISFASSIVKLIPVIGSIASAIVLFVLICKYTDAEFWPDAVLMVIVAWALSVFAIIFIASQMACNGV